MVYIGKREYPLGRMIMSHMAADTLEELHEMAAKIGVDKKHFQDKPNRPHYDICKTKKGMAIRHGAQLVDDRELIRMFQKKTA